MVIQGRIEDWNDARGFGFVRPHGGGEKAFVHISSCRLRGRRPDNGLVVCYRTRTDERGRLTATNVELVKKTARVQGRIAKAQSDARGHGHGIAQRFRLLLALATLAALASALYLKLVPWWLPTGYLGLSLVTFVQYAIDKSQARANAWRTPESNLHMMALIGGWPGALLAQALLHHKNAKTNFQVTFWLCVFANVAIVGTLTGPLLR